MASSSFTFRNKYAVSIRVKSAKDLMKADLLGKSDPYVRVSIDNGPEQKTCVKSSTLNPTWNEQFTFMCSKEPKKVRFSVWDADKTGKSDPLGDGKVSLSHFMGENKAADIWITLDNAKTGRINLWIQCKEIPQCSGYVHANTENEIENFNSLFYLTVVEARSLKHTDHSLSNGKPDPFLVVQCGLNSYQTNVIQDENHPVWNKTCPIWLHKDGLNHLIKISVYDFDSYTKSDLIGNVILKPSAYEFGTVSDIWVPLSHINPTTDADLSELLNSQKIINPSEIGKDSTNKLGFLHLKISHKSKDEVTKTFYDDVIREYDSSGDGLLQIEEFVHMCQTLGFQGTDEKIEEMYNNAADDATGVGRDALPKLLGSDAFRSSGLSMKLHSSVQFSQHADEKDESEANSGILHSMLMEGVIAEPDQRFSVADEYDAKDNSGTAVIVYDRDTGMLVREAIPGYIKSAMKVLYRTGIGRSASSSAKVNATLSFLTKREGKKMNNPKSAANIPAFIDTHQLNVKDIELPLSEYKTFNEFFYRKLKPGARPVESPDDPTVAISPADARTMVFKTVDLAKELWIKGDKFSISNLLGGWDTDGSKAAHYAGGSFAICRLAPQDYHRWHIPVAGKLQARFPIDGGYTTVNPIAIRRNVNVYTTNKRVICPIDTKHFGTVILIAVAATMVGSINFECNCGTKEQCKDGKCMIGKEVKKFDPHGYFAFGGSTTLLLFPPATIVFDSDLQNNSDRQLETLVKVGSGLGKASGVHK